MKIFFLVIVLCLASNQVLANDVVIPSDKPITVTTPEMAALLIKPEYKAQSGHESKDTAEGGNTNEDEAPQAAAFKFNEAQSDKPLSYIGDEITVTTVFEDTLMDLGRTYNVGYVEMVAANPDLNPIFPGEGHQVIIPQKHLIPDAPREGLVINLAEMRLYNFVNNPNRPTSHPIGIGRDGLNTPLGITTITRKKDGPSWRPTPRMRKADPTLPAVVEPGPDNPLGTHALYLGWPQYLIHGTHKPLGVGRRVSSGCLRMYPEDIIQIFRDIPVGTQVNVIKEPIKIAWIDDMLYLEAHAEDDLADMIEAKRKVEDYRVPETLFERLKDKAGEDYNRLDWPKIRQAIKSRDGRPIPILAAEATDKDESSSLADNPLLDVDEPVELATNKAKPMKTVLNE